jgi:hypothetical protein
VNLRDRVVAGFGPEDHAQYQIIQYCDLHNIPVFHVPNSTWTKSVMVRMKNLLLGVRPGVSDLFHPLPGVGMVIVELKRPIIKGKPKGVVSSEQRYWIDLFNKVPNTEAFVANGFDEWLAIMQQFIPTLQKPTTTLF